MCMRVLLYGSISEVSDRWAKRLTYQGQEARYGLTGGHIQDEAMGFPPLVYYILNQSYSNQMD